MKNFSTLLKELKLSTTQEQLEEERYLVFDLEEDKDLYEGVYNYFNDESLEESIGNLHGVPPGLRNTIVGYGENVKSKVEGNRFNDGIERESEGHYRAPNMIHGGEHSKREESATAKSKTQLKSMINNAVGENKMAIIHKNGKPIAAIAHSSGSAEWKMRPSYSVHTPDSSDVDFYSSEEKGRGRHGYTYSREHSKSDFPKNDAVDRAISKVNQHIDYEESENEHFKKNKYHVVTIGSDKRRDAARQARREGRKEDDALDTNTKIAAKKLAHKVLGDTGSPYYVATSLHKKLGDAIDSGNTAEAAKLTKELSTHINDYYGGISRANKDIDKYAETLVSLKRNDSDNRNDGRLANILWVNSDKEKLKKLRDLRK